MQNKKKLLVTGGCGYIGSLLVHKAAWAGYQVHVIDQVVPPLTDFWQLPPSGELRFFEGSLADRALLKKALLGVDAIVHFAGISDGRAGKMQPELTRQVNIDAMQILLEEVHKVSIRKFLFASTMGVYGNQYQEPLTENLALVPIDPYSASKAIGEEMVQSYAKNFSTLSLRIAMVYGKGIRIREDFLLNKLCKLAVETRQLTLEGGNQRRPQIHVSDLNDFILELLSSKYSSFDVPAVNVVESNPSVAEMAELLHDLLPDLSLTTLDSRADEDSFTMSDAKLRELFRFQPLFTLQKGIADTVSYYQTKNSPL